MKRITLLLGLFLLAAGPGQGIAQTLPVDPKVPHPYWFKVFAQGAKHRLLMPTCLTFDQKGRLWVCNLGGTILRMEDKNGDGVADTPVYQFPVSSGAIPNIVSMLFVGSDLWVSLYGTIGVFKDANKDGEPDPNFLTVIPKIPHNYHETNQLVLGPDGWIYVSIGSLYNQAPGAPNLATVVRFDPAARNPGSTLQIFCRGIRNTFDLCFDDKGNLFGGDNGRDDLGLQAPPEELNHLVKGGFYGFPTEGANTIPPIATFPSHSSPCGILFYTHPRFPGFAGSLLMVLHRPLPGNWAVNTTARTRKIVRIQLFPSGKTFKTKVFDWVTGFGSGDPPLDIAMNKDGEVFAITYNASGIPEARVLKFSYPFLDLDSKPKRGGKLKIRTWAKAGWAVFNLLGIPSSPLPTPFGKFALSPYRFMVVLGSGVAPGNDLFVQEVPLPKDPSLIGAKLGVQALEGPLTSPNKLFLTNMRDFTIQ